MPGEARGESPRRWPPSAVRGGVDLSTGAVIGLFVGMQVAGYLSWNLVVGRPFSVVGWEWDPTTTAVTRQLIGTSGIQLILWVVVLVLLGWRRSAGLVIGSASLWGIVPLALFWTAALMAAGLTNVISKGGGFIVLAVVGVFLAALNEEIAFRGFLFHGLTRRLGGTTAVLLGSALFAAAHLPVEMGGHHDVPVVIVVLVGHFGSGVALCRIRAETRAVWIPAGVHTLYNLTTVAFAIWRYPSLEAPTAFILLKLGFIATGLLLALRLVTRRRWRDLRANVTILSGIRAADPAAIARPPGGPPGWGDDPTPLPGHVGEPSRSSPFARFSGTARLAVVLARAEALTEQDARVGTEHLLLGIIAADPEGIASRALEEAGIALNPSSGAGGGQVEGRDIASDPQVPFTPRSKLALATAIREANRLGHAEIGPEHLLLGAIADPRGEASRVLRRLGASPSRVRRLTLGLMPPAAEAERGSNGAWGSLAT